MKEIALHSAMIEESHFGCLDRFDNWTVNDADAQSLGAGAVRN
jgi:hypothetical protein